MVINNEALNHIKQENYIFNYSHYSLHIVYLFILHKLKVRITYEVNNICDIVQVFVNNILYCYDFENVFMLI